MLEGFDANCGKAGLTQLLRERRKLASSDEDNFNVLDTKQLADTLSGTTRVMTMLLGAVAAVSLLVGGIGIMNIMLVSVTERTREIGVRKALGAKAGAIRAQFLIEALVVTLIAGALGVVGGVGLSFVIGQVQTSVVPQVQASSVIAAVGVSVLIGVVFGLYPAWRASLLAPVEALRYE